MKFLAVAILALLFMPFPPIPGEVVLPPMRPSKPVGLFRSDATFKALGWRSQWEWQGAQAALKKLKVDYEIVDPQNLEGFHGRLLVLPNIRNMSPDTVQILKEKRIPLLATYMSSYRSDDNSSWSPNNFALSSLFGVDFKSWVGSGSEVDNLVLTKAVPSEEQNVPLGRHLAMLVRPHSNSKVLATWTNDQAAIVEGPGGIYIGEDLFAPENSESLQVLRLLSTLLNRLAPQVAVSPKKAGSPEWPNPPLSKIETVGQTMRVGLEPLKGRVSFRARNGLVINGRKIGNTYSWNERPATVSGKPFLEVLYRQPNDAYRWTAYRGSLEIGENGTLVNVLDLEHYLAGVVPSEVPAYFPKEALRTMAVVARTYGLSHLKRHPGFDVCSEVHCQVYRGLAGEASTTNLAIAATTGLELLYRGKAADATFHAACGGMGEDAWRAWPREQKDPYLAGKPDLESTWQGALTPESSARSFLDQPPASYCSASGRFRWKEAATRRELRDKLLLGLQGTLGDEFHGLEDLISITVLERSPNLRVNQLEVRSSTQKYVIKGDAIRWLWSGGRIGTGGLQSTFFYVDEDKVNDTFTLVGGGWGHGVGLCQQGASGRALAGQSYKEILDHYYPGTKLDIFRPAAKEIRETVVTPVK